MTTNAMPIELLEPVAEPVIEPGHLAPRLDSLQGKRIGLYANLKLNAVELMDQIHELLSKRYQLAGVIRGTYNAGRVMRPEEWGQIDGCDAVILTHGD
jgi:hypothetical protein